MSNWCTKSCSKCGNDVHYLPEWDKIPNMCKDCKAENNAKWEDRSCKDCGTSFKVHIEWDKKSDLCKTCIERHKAMWFEVSCKTCGAQFKINREWDKKPEHCKSCHERNKAKWKSKSCPDCGTKINYHEDWEKIPNFCKECHEKRRAMWLKKTCQDCQSEFSYHKDWEKVPNFCKKCQEKFRANSVEIVCEECKTQFWWNTSKRAKPDEKLPQYCKRCFTDMHNILVCKYQSHNSYELRTDLEFYGADKIEHFMRGLDGNHSWTGIYENANPQDIINAAAELARSTGAGVLEFRDKVNGNPIKYDVSSTLVVIFKDDRIITTYMIHQELGRINGKLDRPDGTGWEGI